jgi:RNA polymerase-interacting CarD/CdnL/TRCF family regulator
MSRPSFEYAVEDWVVHRHYGVGQIKKVEIKPINGKRVNCYRVKLKDGVFWFPIHLRENPRVRPVSSKRALNKALGLLGKINNDLDPDRKIWKERIDTVKAGGELVEMCLLIRDLTTLRTYRKLNQTETEALEVLKERVLLEWSVSTNTDLEENRNKLEELIIT